VTQSLVASVRRIKEQNLSVEDYARELFRLAGLDAPFAEDNTKAASDWFGEAERVRGLRNRILELEERVRQLETQS
jgi:hypothetical protein